MSTGFVGSSFVCLFVLAGWLTMGVVVATVLWVGLSRTCSIFAAEVYAWISLMSGLGAVTSVFVLSGAGFSVGEENPPPFPHFLPLKELNAFGVGLLDRYDVILRCRVVPIKLLSPSALLPGFGTGFFPGFIVWGLGSGDWLLVFGFTGSVIFICCPFGPLGCVFLGLQFFGSIGFPCCVTDGWRFR